MKRLTPLLLALALAATAADARVRNVTDADAPRSLSADGPVAVQWNDPAGFTELKFSGNRWESQRGNWVFQLADHLRKEAEKRLPEGERLEVTINDIDRAGRYEPGRGIHMDSIRIMRDFYPPMMDLTFTRYDAAGNVVDEGERRLRDTMYLSNASIGRSSDSLRYEKQMIDDWLRRELGQRIATR
ncbi:DUF3016 domain-containing protein [Luteimonas aestuarii]|uniref:DUF3016 domain-containing protein n=1 Tax=Luteimonas aestuarii TaxID=453837 RepID=A0A4R5TSI2_9GAMM|nr:DUF3016 domain-containing protein [Luteimonas aestuarii]TDK23177.1 DUF3016 domain-containing protein [Luteimonas aestuarii]